MNYKLYLPHPEILAVNEAQRIEWAEALESGEYEQCKAFMYNGTGFCCLGVLELIKGRPKHVMLNKTTPARLSDPFRLNSLEGLRLPQNIGIASTNLYPKLIAENLNDRKHLAFPQIARLIRGMPVVVDL